MALFLCYLLFQVIYSLFYCQDSTQQPGGYHSLVGHMMSLNLQHPLHVLPPFGSTRDSGNILGMMEPLQKDLPCELHLLNLRVMQNKESSDQEFMPRKETAMLLHRLGVDCNFPTKGLLCKPGIGQVIKMFHKYVKEKYKF